MRRIFTIVGMLLLVISLISGCGLFHKDDNKNSQVEPIKMKEDDNTIIEFKELTEDKKEIVQWMDYLSIVLQYFNDLDADTMNDQVLEALLEYMNYYDTFQIEQTEVDFGYSKEEVERASQLLLGRAIKEHISVGNWEFNGRFYKIPEDYRQDYFIIPKIIETKQEGDIYIFTVDLYLFSGDSSYWEFMPDYLSLGYDNLFNAIADGVEVQIESKIRQEVKVKKTEDNNGQSWNTLISVKNIG